MPKISTAMPKQKRSKKEPDASGFPCSMPGCAEAGDYKAPLSPKEVNQYRWFCLTHVREYNANWDYFSGMHAGQIEDFIREAPLGHRPTWKINADIREREERLHAAVHDMMYGSGASRREKERLARKRRMTGAQRRALAVLNLDETATLQEIKKEYKLLVKKHHPDVNAGDKKAEERFKRITGAYQELIKMHNMEKVT